MNTTQKKEIELMQTDPTKVIKKLSTPITLSLVVMMLNNLVDTAWVSGLGAAPLAAVGFVTPLYIALIGLGIGLGSGTNSLLARKIGANNKKEANNVAIHSFILIIILTIVTTFSCIYFLDDILLILGAKDVIVYARSFGFFIILGMYSMLIPDLLAAIFRSEGSIKKATYPFIVSSFVNMIIDPIFIYTMHLGVAGAAMGTVLSQTIFSLIPMLYWIFIEKDTYIKINFKDYKRDLNIYKGILNVGLPASLEEIIIAVLTAVINGVLIIVGSNTAVAVFSATWKLVSIGIMPAIGVSIAAITVIGATYGAKNWKMLKQAFQSSIEIAFFISLAVNILFYLFAGEITALFAYSPINANLVPMIRESLRTVGLYICIVPFGLIAASYFQGIGKGTISLAISIMRELILIIASIIIFAIVLGFGEVGVYVGIVVGASIGSLIAYIYTKYHLNKTIKMKGA